MIQKIKSWLNKERLDGHQPNQDPEGPPPRSGGLDITKAPGSVEAPENESNNKKPLIEFEVNNHYDVKELRNTAKRLENEAEKLRNVANHMEKGYNIQVGDVKEQ